MKGMLTGGGRQSYLIGGDPGIVSPTMSSKTKTVIQQLETLKLELNEMTEKMKILEDLLIAK